MIHKLIMQLAKENWGMEFALKKLGNEYQRYPSYTTYGYQEVNSSEISSLVHICNTHPHIDNLADLGVHIKSIYASALFEDKEGKTSNSMTIMQTWMLAIYDEDEITFSGVEGYREMITISESGKYNYYNWDLKENPSETILAKLSASKKPRLSIVVSPEHKYVSIDHARSTVFVPSDRHRCDTLLERYFIEDDILTAVVVDIEIGMWLLKVTQYHINHSGLISTTILESASPVVSTDTMNKLSKRRSTACSPIMTPGEKEFISSMNTERKPVIYEGKNLFIGYKESDIYLNLPQTGWIPVRQEALEIDTLPEETLQEIALYKNL